MGYYRLTEPTFINGALQEAGDVVQAADDIESPNVVEVDGETYRAERTLDPGPGYSYRPTRTSGSEYAHPKDD